jgi:hypothetical protein
MRNPISRATFTFTSAVIAGLAMLLVGSTAIGANATPGVLSLTEPGQPVLAIQGEVGIMNAPIPEGTRQAMLAEWKIEGNPNDTYFLNPVAAQDIEWSIANNTLAPSLEPYAEELDAKGGCDDWTRTQSKGLDLSFSTYDNSWINGNFTGNLMVSADITGSATGEVTYVVKRHKVAFVCIPYWVKLMQARAYGNAQVNGDVTASGSLTYSNNWTWEKQIAKPSLGSLTFWVGPVPIYLGFNLPIVARLKLNATVAANATVTGEVHAVGSFDLACNFNNCSGTYSYSTQSPTTPQLSGSVSGRALLTASVDVGVRAYLYSESVAWIQLGVRPTGFADIWGYAGNTCGDANGDGTPEWVTGLTLDFDGQVFLTGAANALNQGPWLWNDIAHTSKYHLWFIAPDDGALRPLFPGPSNGYIGSSLLYRYAMGQCVPYGEPVSLSLNWGSGPLVNLTGYRNELLPISHTWTTSGTKTVTLHAMTDTHGRNYNTTTNRYVLIIPADPEEDEDPQR